MAIRVKPTAKVKYTGSADFRELTEADFSKLSISHPSVTFTKGEPTELPVEVATALLTHELVSGEFKDVLAPEEVPASEEASSSDQLPLE